MLIEELTEEIGLLCNEFGLPHNLEFVFRFHTFEVRVTFLGAHGCYATAVFEDIGCCDRGDVLMLLRRAATKAAGPLYPPTDLTEVS